MTAHDDLAEDEEVIAGATKGWAVRYYPVSTTFQCDAGEHDLTVNASSEVSDFEDCPFHPGSLLRLKGRLLIWGDDCSAHHEEGA